MNQNDVDRILYLQEKASEMRRKSISAANLKLKVLYGRLARDYRRTMRRELRKNEIFFLGTRFFDISEHIAQ